MPSCAPIACASAPSAPMEQYPAIFDSLLLAVSSASFAATVAAAEDGDPGPEEGVPASLRSAPSPPSPASVSRLRTQCALKSSLHLQSRVELSQISTEKRSRRAGFWE